MCCRSAVVLLLCCSACMGQAVAPAESTPATTPAGAVGELDRVLLALSDRGRTMRNLAADISLTDRDASTGSDETRVGQFWLGREGDTRMRVNFDFLDTPDTRVRQRIEYHLQDGWLTERNYATLKQTRRQLRPPGQQVDLLRLGQGPFPLPIGQDPTAVRQEFIVTQLPPNPVYSGLIGVQLRPRPGTQLADRFDTITAWVDMSQQMPLVIESIDVNLTTIRIATLAGVRFNDPQIDQQLALEPIDPQGWNLIEEPLD